MQVYAEQRRIADQVAVAINNDGDDPAVVAKVIVAAATDTRPKPRYAAGPTARRVSVASRIVPARVFERIIRKANRLTPDACASTDLADKAENLNGEGRAATFATDRMGAQGGTRQVLL
ncbi:hypothetical protein [Streptomyces sp. NPDC019937]|uniref:hypothetical protein n=1 Tax=Streptomyces sp. NPDC019937 TaxID=3154787 RepID=UPI0033F8D85D